MNAKISLFAAATLVALSAVAAEPWGKADPKAGKALHDKACTSCHSRLYGGDGSKIYSRAERLVSSPPELMKRVAFCSAQTKAGWQPEQDAEVAAYLNQQYYHFKE